MLTAGLLALVASAAAQSVPVSIPLTAPSSAPKLSGDLLSISIEQDLWTDWVGTTSVNTFFLNTLKNIEQRTGIPPWIRIGANSEDKTNFNPAVQFSEDIFPAPTNVEPFPEASSIVVGEGYYQLASHLPPGSHVIWGVNFGQSNLTAAVLEAQALNRAFDSGPIRSAGITLDFVEIGNEADLYSNNGDRPSSNWTIQTYVDQWTAFATNVSVAAGITRNSARKFIGCAFAGSSGSTSSFSPQGAFAHGLLNTTQGELISTVSQHHYSGSFCSGSGGLLQDLMTKSTIRSNLSSFSPDIAAVHAQGLDYILGETNSYSCHGAPGVSNAAGAALWTLDYTLFASQIGVSRLHFHDGIGFKYNLVQPVTLTKSIIDGSALPSPLPPHVQPQYYSAIIVAEAIGSSGNTKAVELTLDDDRLSGYAFFENGALKRAVLINSEAFFTTDTTPRTSKNITISLSGSGAQPRFMDVKRLNIGHADDTGNLTWGGLSFETSDAFPTGKQVIQTLPVSQGVTISETEVLMLSFH